MKHRHLSLQAGGVRRDSVASAKVAGSALALLGLLLDLDWAAGDQVAIVTFNAEARTVQPLASDLEVLRAAFRQLGTDQQSRIHRGRGGIPRTDW